MEHDRYSRHGKRPDMWRRWMPGVWGRRAARLTEPGGLPLGGLVGFSGRPGLPRVGKDSAAQSAINMSLSTEASCGDFLRPRQRYLLVPGLLAVMVAPVSPTGLHLPSL